MCESILPKETLILQTIFLCNWLFDPKSTAAVFSVPNTQESILWPELISYNVEISRVEIRVRNVILSIPVMTEL